MIRILIALCVALFAHGQASAEMAKAKPKPAKEMTVSGCTFLGLEGCYYINVGKERVTLTANAGVVIPPPRTFVIAKGKLVPVEIGFCGVKHSFHASSIVSTKRLCPPKK